MWIDGKARVACVTAARRAAGRSVVTLEGVDPDLRSRWVEAFCEVGASQCGFCTPGILMRLAALGGGPAPDEAAVRTALLAHLCRCTGWQSIVEAAHVALGNEGRKSVRARDPLLVAWRAQIESCVFQASGPGVVEGNGGFSSDTAPDGSLVAVRDGASVSIGEDLASAGGGLPKVQGRRSGTPLRHPVEVPAGDWALVLQTTWVEPAYLEPDASWCRPGEAPSSPVANGGAFGGKRDSPVATEARDLAEAHGGPVLALWTREEVVRRGPKRPPVAIGIRPDGTGVLRLGWSEGSPPLGGLRAAIGAAAPGLEVEQTKVLGPPVDPLLRAAGWAEAAIVMAALSALAEGAAGGAVPVEVVGRSGGRARVLLGEDRVEVDVWAGEVLDETTLRSYCFGAVHQGLGWVRSEGIAVDEEGQVQDLTVRSFGILSARDTPRLTVRIHPSDLLSVNASDAVFAAAAAAAWLADNLAPKWPTRRAGR